MYDVVRILSSNFPKLLEETAHVIIMFGEKKLLPKAQMEKSSYPTDKRIQSSIVIHSAKKI